MPNAHLGDPTFRWWWGCVEDRLDPLQKGRVRVRIHGYHSPFQKDINTQELPWAEVLQPVTMAASPQAAPVGIFEGAWVFGFFKDGNECQQPVVMGFLTTLPEIENAKDTKGTDTLQQKNSDKATFQKNYGDGFRDPRTDEDLKEFPSKDVERKYPLSKGKPSDKRGAELKELPPQRQTDRQGRTITINDKLKIDETIIKLKKTPRPDGLLNTEIHAANIEVEEEFKCGVINVSKANKGTLSGLGSGDNSYKSSLAASEFKKWKLYTEKPKNAANKNIMR